MKKIGIVTDSHSSISQEEAEKLGIFVLPMPFYIDGECYYESVTCPANCFLRSWRPERILRRPSHHRLQ